MIEPEVGALFRDVIFDGVAVLGFLGAVGGLECITRPHDGGADVTIRDVIDRLAGMDVAQMRTDRVQDLAGLLEITGLGAGAVAAHIGDHVRQHVCRRIKDHDAAILELRGVFRVKHQGPAVRRGVGAEPLFDHRHIIGHAGGAPHIDSTGIADTDLVVGEVLHLHVLLAVVAELCQVEILIGARLAAARQKIARRHDDVIARGAGQHLGLENLVRVVHVIGDLDAGLRLEIGDGVLGDIVRPVIDIQLVRNRGTCRQSQRRGSGDDRCLADMCHGGPPLLKPG